MRNMVMATNFRNGIGGLIMTVFATIAAYRWAQTGSLFFALLVFRDLLVAYLIVTRAESSVKAPLWHSTLAYVSSGASLIYLPATTEVGPLMILIANLLAIVGFLLATLAAIELGAGMGVSPAKRGEVCRTGIYRFIKHPMYVGYAIAEFSRILLNPLNIALYAFSMLLYFSRARLENRVLCSVAVPRTAQMISDN
jgi:protein-S-isoprenylcysteine O-methyltransferase Ste14